LYATEFISGLDIDKPNVMRSLYKKYGDQWMSTFTVMTKSLGFTLETDQEVYRHYEDDVWHRAITVSGAISGTGASHAAFTIPLAATDVFTDALSGTNIFPRVGDIIELPNNGTGTGTDRQAIITAVTPGTPSVTAKLIEDPTYTVPTLSAGDKIIIISGAFAEGTDQPKSLAYNIKKYTNKLQIVKETWKGTGTQITQGTWFENTNDGGTWKYGFASYGMEKVDYEMALKQDGALLFQRPAAATAVVDPIGENGVTTGRYVPTTKGMFPEMQDRSPQVPYTVGSMSITKFNQIATKIEQNNGGSKTYCVFHSFNLGLELEDLMVDYMDNTNVSYIVNASGAMEDNIVAIGFKGFMKAGITFLFKKLGTLSNTQTYGAAGFEYRQNLAFCLPMSRTTVYADPQKRDTMDAPTWGVRYKKLGAYSRMTETWTINGTGMTGQRKISENDSDKLFTRSHLGYHGIAFEQMVLVTGS